MRVAVIVNDMSEGYIDASLVERTAESAGAAISRTEEKMVDMSNGCVCCNLREDLLLKVSKPADEGRFEYLLIGSTSIGEPMPVAAVFDFDFDFEDVNSDSLNDRARIDTIVEVVDALNLLADFSSIDLLEQRRETSGPEDQRTLAALLTEQIEFANVVVINKIDRVDAARRDEATAVVKALNPAAEIVYADHGQVPLRQILGTGRFDLERASAMPGRARELQGQQTPETGAHGIESFVLRSTKPLHPWRFCTFMDLPFPGLIRAKGCVWLASRAQWLLSHSRAGNTATHEPVERWWAAVPSERWPAKGSPQRFCIESREKEPPWKPPQRGRVQRPRKGPLCHSDGPEDGPPQFHRRPQRHEELGGAAQPVPYVVAHRRSCQSMKPRPIIPSNYADWRRCIEVDCGIAGTPEIVALRIEALTRSESEEARRFAALDGSGYLRRVIGWFCSARPDQQSASPASI